jgi:hypothetical protein
MRVFVDFAGRHSDRANTMRRNSGRGLLPPGVVPTRHHAGRGDRRHQLERRKHQIEARIASMDARDQVTRRKRETRANVIIGAVMRSHAALHPTFAEALASILAVAVRRQADRDLLASILGLPHLAPSGDPGPSPQPVDNVSGTETPGPAAPQRSRLRRYAAEITMRR